MWVSYCIVSCSLKGSKSFKRHVHVLSTSPIDSKIHTPGESRIIASLMLC